MHAAGQTAEFHRGSVLSTLKHDTSVIYELNADAVATEHFECAATKSAEISACADMSALNLCSGLDATPGVICFGGR
jgi:hypothetical protein